MFSTHTYTYTYTYTYIVYTKESIVELLGQLRADEKPSKYVVCTLHPEFFFEVRNKTNDVMTTIFDNNENCGGKCCSFDQMTKLSHWFVVKCADKLHLN